MLKFESLSSYLCIDAIASFITGRIDISHGLEIFTGAGKAQSATRDLILALHGHKAEGWGSPYIISSRSLTTNMRYLLDLVKQARGKMCFDPTYTVKLDCTAETRKQEV